MIQLPIQNRGMTYLDKVREKPYFKKPEHIEISSNELGGGAYGIVYIGKCHGKQCAVKVIHRYLVQNQSPESLTKPLEQFLQECEFASQARNEHIVRFLGVSINSPDGKVEVPVLVTELMECDLTTFLDCKYCALPYHREINVARDIALGLDYLHTCSPPIVHRDLSGKNILLAADYTAKIADLGVAKCLEASPCSPMPGTTVYMPPEVFQRCKLSVAIDLFSYGVLMVQLETRKFPNPKDDVEEETVEGFEEESAEGVKLGLRENQLIKEDDEDETPKRKPEIERRRNHLDLMEESGVLYRIAVQYLQDRPWIRRQMQLKDVLGWLEEETHSKKYQDTAIDSPMTPVEHRLHSRRERPTAATNPTKVHARKRQTKSSGTQESGYFSQSMQRGNTAPPPTAQVAAHGGGPGLQVVGAGPQDTAGRGVWRAMMDSLSQIPGKLGLATNNEDDKAYQQRVMKSL